MFDCNADFKDIICRNSALKCLEMTRTLLYMLLSRVIHNIHTQPAVHFLRSHNSDVQDVDTDE